MPLTATEAGLALTDPATYVDDARLHEALGPLRHQAPVHRVEAPGFEPFWAITRHAEIMAIERNNLLFRNAPRPVLANAETDARTLEREADGTAVRTLIHMDDPRHRVMRAVTADWFRPRAMRTMEEPVQKLARHYADWMADRCGEFDFAAGIAIEYPLYVILSLLGLADPDFPRMLKLSRELSVGAAEEARRGETPDQLLEARLDFFACFEELKEARRAIPTNDLGSAIANARVDGEYLSDWDIVSYYALIVTAGHETVSWAISGGLHALIEYSGELARLRDNPALLPTAVDEMVRWASPVNGFMRTAAADTEVGGMPIAQGESLLLSYPSANRDEEVFGDPFRFDVGRDPNRHLAFGFGVHQCLGAALARMEMRALFAELLPRLESIELAGRPEWMATQLAHGLKHLPIRCRMTA
jgi:cytochrome P450